MSIELSPREIMIEQLQHRNPIYYDEMGSYWIWDKEQLIYKMKDDTSVMNTFKREMNKRVFKPKDKSETLELIRQTGRDMDLIVPDKNVVVFDGIAVNIATGEYIVPTPDCFYTSRIPHKIGDSYKTPMIDALFKSWVGDRTYSLYEICAYCMYNDIPIHRLIGLIGYGRNGKGQFTHLLERFIGLDNTVATDIELLATNRNATAKLYKKKVATVGETDHKTMLSTKRLKELVGGDYIDGEFKFKNAFSFMNTAKLIVSTNALPGTLDRTDGYYSRWFIIAFLNQFAEGPSVVDPIPEWEFENLANKCIPILKALLKRGGFRDEGTIDARREMYELYSNPVGTFVKTMCVVKEGYNVPRWVLWEAYDKFQREGKYRIMTGPEFKDELHNLTGLIPSRHWYSQEEITRYRDAENGASWERYDGIALKSHGTRQATL